MPVALLETTTPREPSVHFLHATSPGSSEYKALPSHARQTSTEVDDEDTDALKNPMAQATQLGCAKCVPAALVNLPAWHLAWEVHLSVTVDNFDAVALKKPTAHASQDGATDDEPATAVNFPASHLG